MRRITYAPKAYVFVRSSTQGGRIYNISPDVVSGEVNRTVNDVSTATIVMRNRFRKWLKDPTNKKSILMPMDMITIWLQRIGGKPIQVFTGYLDSVPYYQMYPGDCQLTASCTLKRLKFAYFDPGLQWFTQWFNGIEGWKINPQTGEVINTALQAQAQSTKKNKMKINDGGFADLIQQFMITIAGWSPDNVIISDLPSTLPKTAAKLYSRIQKQDEQIMQAVEELLGNIMGISASPITSQTQDIKTNQQQALVKTIKTVAESKNIPLTIPITAALLASGMKSGYSIRESRASAPNEWGYGLYAMKPNVTEQQDLRTKNKAVSVEAGKVDGVDKTKLSNPDTATTVFLNRMQKVNTPQTRGGGRIYAAALKGDVGSMQAWIQKALNRTFSPTDFAGALAQAKSVIATFNNPKSAIVGGGTGIPTPKDLTWASVSATSGPKNTNLSPVMDSADFNVYSKVYTKANNSLVPYYWMAKTHYPGIHLVNPGGPMSDTLVLGGNAKDLQGYFDSVKGHNNFTAVTLVQTSGGSATTTTYRGGRKSAVGEKLVHVTGQTGSIIQLKVAANASYPAWTISPQQGTVGRNAGSGVGAGGVNSAMGQQFTLEDLGSISFASAFLSNFTLSGNWMESNFLTGYKALMNDITCLTGVQQFCQSSMRSFMSLPDGKFCAFYPDYFGAHGRKPYWYIYDIEILNGGVVLSDEQLATHVYTVGDTTGGAAGAGGSVTDIDYLNSAGVVTLDMGILSGFINPLENQKENIQAAGNDENMGELKTAADFIYHYGARVYEEQVPLIRNQYYEFLYAWQRFMQKWAATFQTTLEFTFQPEVMVGGIIGFPQHNLQMYCESVTHSWDYTSGFQTTATLSSPAAMSATSNGDIGSLPGFALAGNINSVGTPAGQ